MNYTYNAQNRLYDADTHRFTQKDPANDGWNWYAYCGNNPLVLIDPSGRTAVRVVVNGKTIINAAMDGGSVYASELELKTALGLSNYSVDTKVLNRVTMAKVRDMVKEKDRISGRQSSPKLEDYLSWWYDNLDGRTMHVTVHEAQLEAPVTLVRDDDRINIRGNVVFTGDYTEIHKGANMSYRELVKAGITQIWRGTRTINGKSVWVNTELYDRTGYQSGYKYFTIDIPIHQPLNADPAFVSGSEGPTNWTITSNQIMTIYQERVTGTLKYDQYPESDIRGRAAHEFGHILGVSDAYPHGNRPDASTNPGGLNIVSPEDLMCYNYNLSGWDVAMALQAFTMNGQQFWGSFVEVDEDGNIHYYDRSEIIGKWNCP